MGLLTCAVGQAQSSLSLFNAVTVDSSVAIGYGLAIGDVDGDGKPDILLADKKQFVWYRNGDWKKFVMAENLTEFDNVCIAAMDVDGDGNVEVAVGAQWNPGETTDKSKSGSVHFLVRPTDPTQAWQVKTLYHEQTIHRMRWVQSGKEFYLAVLPLHGAGNKDGVGTPVNLLLYKYPGLLTNTEPTHTINTGMHLTHNFDIGRIGGPYNILIGGKEGLKLIPLPLHSPPSIQFSAFDTEKGVGEVRIGRAQKNMQLIAAIEPMHGNSVVVYDEYNQRQVLDSSLAEGHAIAVADFLGDGKEQVVAGWRRPDKNGKVGIKLFYRAKQSSPVWEMMWIDKNGMACEDLQVADLNGDGKPDIVASGRQTKNLKIYWNISGKK